MEVDENADKKTKEECYICGHLCNPRRMLSHIRSHTNVEIHECEVCLERFSTKKSLHKHYISHSTHYICVHCNKKFVDPILLKQHECHDDERTTFTCDICGKQFYQKSRLDKHLISHAEKQHVCDCCGKSFRHKGNLTAHYRIHYKGEDGQYVKSVLQEKHECEECKKRFVSKRNLQRHYLCHTNEKPYMCEICNKYFAHKHNMESHLRLHFDDNKPYVCEICGKDFNRKYNLKVHYIMHNRKETGEAAHKIQKEKTFVCSICCKAFISKRNHDRHQVTHTKEKPYECELCDMKFAYDSTLKRHTYLHFGGYQRKKKRPSDVNGNAVDDNVSPEEKPRVCNVCNVYFENKLEFRNHIRVDKQYGMYKCCICSQIFKVKKGLKEHQKIHTTSAENQPIVCVIKAEPEESEEILP